MIILVGPSASGKTSIAKKLIEKYNFRKFVTNTTRAPRVGEVNDVDYHFISFSEFLEKESKGYFIETTIYNGNHYGTSIEDVSDDKVLIVDIIGANKFYERLGEKAVFFFLSCSEKTTKKRMIERGDSEDDIVARINGDKVYFNPDLMGHVDFYINTDNVSLEEVTEEVYNKYLKTIEVRK